MIQVKDVYVDTVGPAEKYQAKLSALFPTLNITVASKADDKYPICGASSICAKVGKKDHDLTMYVNVYLNKL